MGKPSDLVQGTLDLLILKTISLEPRHGWAIRLDMLETHSGNTSKAFSLMFR